MRPSALIARRALALAFAGLALPALAGGAHAAEPAPTVIPRVFAPGPPNTSHPDDITILGDVLYVTYQNSAGADGTPPGSASTIVAFDRHRGSVLTTYTLLGRCDGLTADPESGRIFASVNEDNNSSLFVITPGAVTPVVHYAYSPDPAETGADGTNGGTDSIAIGADDTVYVAHSNPDLSLPAPNNAAAVYTLTLRGTTANLTPFFGVNDQATVVNPGPGSPATAPLGLTDPDSNRFVRGRDGGTLIQDAQADSKLVFATRLQATHPQLRVLNLTNATVPSGGAATPQLDDIARVGGPGTVDAVDQATGTIYSIDTAGIDPGTLFVSQPKPKAGDLPNDPALGVVDPRTGVVTRVDTTLGSPKGLLFVPAHGRPDDDQGDQQRGPNDQQLGD